MQKDLHHQHLLIQALVDNPPTDEAALNWWLESLVMSVGMKIVIPPRSIHVKTNGNVGLTGSVNIETSHAAIHVWEEEKPARIEMDLYSCAPFELETVLEKIREFELVSYHYMMVDRNRIPFTVLDQGTFYE